MGERERDREGGRAGERGREGIRESGREIGREGELEREGEREFGRGREREVGRAGERGREGGRESRVLSLLLIRVGLCSHTILFIASDVAAWRASDQSGGDRVDPSPRDHQIHHVRKRELK